MCEYMLPSRYLLFRIIVVDFVPQLLSILFKTATCTARHTQVPLVEHVTLTAFADSYREGAPNAYMKEKHEYLKLKLAHGLCISSGQTFFVVAAVGHMAR